MCVCACVCVCVCKYVWVLAKSEACVAPPGAGVTGSCGCLMWVL